MTYIIEANLGIIVTYSIYYLLLKNETDFSKQRAILILGLLCALIFPLVDLPVADIAPSIEQAIVVLPELTIGALQKSQTLSWTTSEVLLIVYITIALGLTAPLLYQGIRLYKTIRVGAGRYRDDYYVVESNDNRASWSFFKLIYIGRSNELSDEEKQLIMKHEMLHGKLLHSADMLFATIVSIVFWFNPVTWLYRRTLAKVHEFEVDAMVVEQHGAFNYSALLAKTVLNENGFLLTHHFNQSFILKRINMINMIKTKISSWKLVALVTTIVIYFVGVSCTDQGDSTKANIPTDAPANAVEQFQRLKAKYPEAQFELAQTDFKYTGKDLKPGAAIIMLFTVPEKEQAWMITETSGRTNEVYITADQTAEPALGMEGFYNQLGQVLVYPEDAIQKGIEGKVFIEFTVNVDGHLSDFAVKKGIHDGCDTEAVKAILQIGNWKPAFHNKLPVAQKLVLPITFKLNN